MGLIETRRGSALMAVVGGLALLVGGLTSVPDASSAAPSTIDEQAEAQPGPERVGDLASATSDTYLRPDGSYEFVGYTTPINYLTDNGDWAPIDSELVPAAGTTYAVENGENDFTVKFPEDASADPVKIAADGQWVTFEMDGLDGTPVVDATEATYHQTDAVEVSEVIYESRPDGVKESIVLSQPPTGGAVEYTFDFALSAGLTPHLRTTGEIDIVDSANRRAFVMPAPFMTDANGAISTNVSYELDQTAAGWKLVVDPVDGWLEDPERVYPVIVDPTITKTPSTDGWIAEADPTNVNAGGQYLRIGSVTGSRRRALLKFNLNDADGNPLIPSDAVIQSTDGTDPALLRMSLDADLTNGDGTAGLVAGRVKSTQKWAPGHLSWNNREYQTAWETPGGAWDTPSPVATVNIDTSGYKSIDVREAVQKWVQGWANNGFIVKQDTNADKTLFFHSVNTTTTNPPKLVIKYQVPDHPPATPTNLAITPGGTGYTTSASPTVSAKVTDPDAGQSVVAGFELRDNGQTVWEASSSPATSGSTVSAPIPPGILRTGRSYVAIVTARSGNPELASASVNMSFQVDSQAAVPTTSTCTSPCIPFQTPVTLYDGTLTGTATIDLNSLPVADPLDLGYIHYALRVTGSAQEDASTTLYTPDFTKPIKETQTVPAGTTRTAYVKVFPAAYNTVFLANNRTQSTTVRVTALGWEPWDTEPTTEDDPAPTEPLTAEEEAAFNAEYSSMRAGLELEPTLEADDLAGPTSCVKESPSATTEYCFEEILDGASYEQSVLRGDDIKSGTPEQFTSAELAEDAEALAEVDERRQFSSCPEGGDWFVDRMTDKANRGLACTQRHWRVGHYEYKDGEKVPRGRTWMTVEYKVHVSSGDDQGTHVVGRFHYDRGWGWGEAMYFNIQFGCSRCVTTGSETGYFIEGVHKTETLTPPSPIFNTPADGTKWSERFEISFWGGNSHGGVALKVLRRHSPPIRCDNIGYLNGINRGPGCVFPGATAVIGLERSRWPKSVALIERGWAEHGYGDYYHGNKLTRETSKSVARRNRRAAKPYCVNYTETCDEYPFAKTRQGCALRPDLCDTADVPAEQNSGSGGYVGTILTYARVLDGEGYWLFAYGSYG